MGDRSNLNLTVRGATDPRVRAAVVELFESYAGPRSDGFGSYYEDEEDSAAGSLDLGAHEVRVGSVDELDEALQALVTDGTEDENGDHVLVEDFAWQLYDEPEYDWNGDLRVHVPGLPDFSAECDANGSPIIAPPFLVQLVDDATDLDALRRRIRAVTGTDHDEALHAFAPAAGAAPAGAHSSTASTP